MLLTNCKIELKFKWTKYCVLSATGNDNTNDNPDNTFFPHPKHKVIRYLSSLYQQ